MIYLDNAATSYPKPDKVYEDIYKCMVDYCANPGRSGHSMSVRVSSEIMGVREKISNFFGADSPLQVCFTKNATEALNIAIRSILDKGDHVITSSMEHNSVIRPLRSLERDAGTEVTIVDGNKSGEIDADSIKKSIKSGTKLIILTLSSNVNGAIMPVKETGSIARDNKVLFAVDASQGAGSLPLDMKKMNIDLLVFPGHKGLLGPQGTGGLCVKNDVILKPLIQGGTGSNSKNTFQPRIMPDMIESGTLNAPGIIGLGSGIDFLEDFGLENIRLYKEMLTGKLFDGLNDINGIKIYSSKENNSGIIAFGIEGISSSEIGNILNSKYDIAVRAGLHCSPLAHKTLGTLETGLVRLSIGCFNTLDDIDRTIETVKLIVKDDCYK